MEKKISVIIPFLNEKEEVENTIRSVLDYSNNDVEIIVINDASDDAFDYDRLATEYDIKYIKNKNRAGVAASRDMGVELSETPYFLLLDAHMRFYDKDWVKRITDLLDKDGCCILSAQTKYLEKEENGIVSINTEAGKFERLSARVDLENELFLFEPIWKYADENTPKCNILPVPCILGAGYACSKTYWTYLKGLKGLQHYGNDEPYISMKVWMEGGKCYLMRDLTIGHIYRKTPPYITPHTSRVYNKLLINELLVNEEKQKVYFSRLKSNNQFPEAFRLLYNNRKYIQSLKEYYSKIFTKDFSSFENFNRDKFFGENKQKLSEIADYLIMRYHSLNDIGLLKGKMGVIIFLFHYAQFINSKKVDKLANQFLDDLWESVSLQLPYFLESGLSGIGWGIQYLYQKKFIKGDINEILEDFDSLTKNLDIEMIDDLSLENGLGGIVSYINIRLYSIINLNIQNPFNEIYLKSLYIKLKTLVADQEVNTNSINIFTEFIQFYEKEKPLDEPSLYDIMCLRYPENYSVDKYNLGLDGSANVGLKLIFE